jgi:hypothetical protein
MPIPEALPRETIDQVLTAGSQSFFGRLKHDNMAS